MIWKTLLGLALIYAHASFGCDTFALKDVQAVDGDTIVGTIELIDDVFARKKIRVNGVDSAELKSQDPTKKALAIKAKEFTAAFVSGKCTFTRSKTHEKYGRFLGDVDCDGKSLKEELLKNGLAKPYSGGKRT